MGTMQRASKNKKTNDERNYLAGILGGIQHTNQMTSTIKINFMREQKTSNKTFRHFFILFRYLLFFSNLFGVPFISYVASFRYSIFRSFQSFAASLSFGCLIFFLQAAFVFSGNIIEISSIYLFTFFFVIEFLLLSSFNLVRDASKERWNLLFIVFESLLSFLF